MANAGEHGLEQALAAFHLTTGPPTHTVLYYNHGKVVRTETFYGVPGSAEEPDNLEPPLKSNNPYRSSSSNAGSSSHHSQSSSRSAFSSAERSPTRRASTSYSHATQPSVASVSKTVYLIRTKDGRETTTTRWSTAGHRRNKEGAFVKALTRAPKVWKPKSRYYIVFHGRHPGIYYDYILFVLPEVEGYKRAIHIGYSEKKQALRALEFANMCGLTSDDMSGMSPSEVRGRLENLRNLIKQDKKIQKAYAHLNDGKVYVVFKGIRPGVYSTLLESHLNVQGIDDAVHKSYSTWKEAMEEYEYARDHDELEYLL